MANERIGLSAEMDMTNFNKGMSSYNTGLDKMHGQTQSFGSKVSGIFTAAAGVMTGMFAAQAVQKVISGIKETVAAAADEQKGILQLGQAVKNTGANWDTASVAIEGYLKSELKRIALDDGPGRMAIQKLTEITGDYNKSLKLMPLVADLAAAKNMDLASAAMVVGRVSEGNTGMLARYGIMLTKSKDGAANAAGALAELSERFSGQAEILANTYPGAQKKFEIAIGNIKETIGGALLPVIEKASGQFANWAVDVLPAVEWAATGVAKAVGWLTDKLSLAITKVSAFASELISAFQMGGGGELGARNVLATLLEKVGLSEDQIQDFFTFVNGVQDTLKRVFGNLKTTFTAIIADLSRGIASNGRTGGIYAIMNALGFSPDAIAKVNKIVSDVQTAITRAFSTLKSAITRAISDLQRGISSQDIIRTLLTNLGLGPQAAQRIASIFNDVLGFFRREAENWVRDIRGSIEAVFRGDWGALWNIWKERFLQGLRNIGNLAEMIGTVLWEWLRQLPEWVGRKLDDVAVNLGPKFLDWLNKSLTWLSGQIATLGDRFSQVISDLLTWLFADRERKSGQFSEPAGAQFWKLLKDAFTAVAKWAQAEGPNISEDLGQIIGSIIRLAIGLVWKIVSELGKLIWGLISGSMQEATGSEQQAQGRDIISSFLIGLLEGLTGLKWEEMGQIALDMIDGLVSGLEKNTDWLIAQVMAWIRKVIPEPIRKVLGIESPSKVMMQIGLQIVQGLAEGIDAGTVEVVERVASVARAIADTFTSLIAAMQALGGAGGLAMPNVGMWLARLTEILTTTVKAIVDLAGPGKDFAWALGQAAGAIEQMMRVLSLLQVDLSKMAVSSSLPSIAAWKDQMLAVIMGIVELSSDILKAISTNDILALATIMDSIIQVFSLASVDISRMASAANLPNLTLWRTQMVAVFQTIREVVRDILLQPAIEKTGGKFPETVEAIIKIMDLIGVDLSRGAVMLRDFNLTLWRMQMVDMFQAIRLVVRDILLQPPIERTGGKFPETVAAIIDIMQLIGVDLSQGVNLLQGFNVSAWERQMVDVFAAIREVVRRIGLVASVDDLKLMGDKVAEIVKVFGLVAVDLSQLAVAPVVDLLAWCDQMVVTFTVVTTAIMAILWTIERDYFDLDTLAEASGKIVQAFGLLSVDLTQLAELKPLSMPNLLRWCDQIVVVFTVVTTAIMAIVQQLKRDAFDLDVLAAAAGQITAVIGIIKPAIEAIEGLADYVRAKGLAEKAAAFGTDLGTVIFQIVEGLKTSEIQEIPEATLVFAAAIQSMIGVVKPALDAIDGLAKYVQTQDLEARVAYFGADMDIIVYEIYKALQNTNIAVIPEATLVFAAAIQTMIGVVTPALDAIKGLADYVTTQGIEASVAYFGADLDIIVYELYKALQNTGIAEIPEATIKFAQAIQTVVGIVGPAIEAIASLVSYETVGNLQESLMNFSERLGEIVTEIILLASYYDLTGVEAAAKFATAAGTILGVVTDAIDTIAALVEYKAIGTLGPKMQNVVDRLREILLKITALAATPEFAPAALAGAVTFGGQVAAIAGSFKTAIEGIEIIANYRPARDIQYGIADFTGRARALLNAITELKGLYAPQGITESRDFLAAVLQVVENVLAAMEGINRVAAYPFTWGLDYNMTQFQGYISRLITALRQTLTGFEGMAGQSVTMLAAINTIVANIQLALTRIASITLALPGGVTFPDLLSTYLWMAINVAQSRMGQLQQVFWNAVPGIAAAGAAAAGAWNGAFSASTLHVPVAPQALQSVTPGGAGNKTINLSMTNNINSNLDVALFSQQVKQIVRDAIK